MGERDYNQRGGGGGGGVLPNLVTPEGVDIQVLRKRQYLAELQQQAEADRERKAGERPGGRGAGGGARGGGGGQYGDVPQYPSPPRNIGPQQPFGMARGASGLGAVPVYAERGSDFAARLKAGFEAALQQAHQQVVGGPERYPDGPLSGGRDQGSEVMNAMRRWENMFTAQVSASMQAVSELNAHVVLLEKQLSTQGREKQLLRERVEQTEMTQKELQMAKLENETSLRQIMRDEQDRARRMQQEMSELRETLDQVSQQQAGSRVQSEKAMDDIRERQQRHRSIAGTIEERVQTLEARLGEANDTIAALREELAQESRRHSKALEGSTETMAQVISRIKQVEERVVPDIQRYVDKSNDNFWVPLRSEISSLKTLVEELRSRIDQVDDTATSLIVSTSEDASKERRAARDERVAQASDNLSRFQMVNKALTEEKDARLLSEVKMRKEVESMAKAIADSIRDADAEHAGLVEAVHMQVMTRIVQQGDVASVVQEALENKRAFLEEVVRAEIASRFAAMEELKADIEEREAQRKKDMLAAKEEVKAQMKLVQVKVKSNSRSIRNQMATVEAARRIAEQVRQDMEAELLSVSKTQTQAEEQLRASVKSQIGDIHMQLSALTEIVNMGNGLGDMTQEDRDLDQDSKIDNLRAGLSEANARLDALNDRNEHERGRLHKTLMDLKSEHGLLKEDVGAKVAMLGIASEALRENFQGRLESTDQHVQDMRVQMIDVIKDLHEGPETLFREAQSRIDECVKEVGDLRQSLEDRCRTVQEQTSSTCQELATQIETAGSRAALMQQQLRGEQARLDEADKAVRALFETHARENKIWKEDTETRMQSQYEAVMHVRQVFSGELRQIQSAMAETQRGQDLKWQQMDSKLTDDSRRILQAIESFRAAHEDLKASTDEHFAQVLAEDEKNLKRLWTDIQANRKHCDKHFEEQRDRLGKEEHTRKEANEVLHIALEALRQDLHDARIRLTDAIAHEASKREEADTALKNAANALREDSESADHKLSRQIADLQENLVEELKKMQEKAEESDQAHENRSSTNKQDIQTLKASLKELDDDYQGTKALVADVKKKSAQEHAAAQASMAQVNKAAHQEYLERDAAITEVYRRMQMARETDALVTQVTEAALRDQIMQVRSDVESKGEEAHKGVNERMKELSARIVMLQQEEEHIKLKVDDLESSANKNALELRAADQAITKQVEETDARLLRKTSQLQDRLAEEKTEREKAVGNKSSEWEEALKREKAERELKISQMQHGLAEEKTEREKAAGDKSSEWEEALKREKMEREEMRKKEKEEREAGAVTEKKDREAENSALRQRVEYLEAKEKELESGAEKSGADAAEKLAALESKHSDLLQIVAENKTEFEEKLAKEREKEEEDIKSLEARLNEKIDGGSAAASAEIGEKVQTMSAKVEELGNKVVEIEGKIGLIQGKVAEHDEEIKEMEEGKVSAGKFDTGMHEVSLLRDRVVAVEEKSAGAEQLKDKMTAVEEKVTAVEGDYVKSGALEKYITDVALEKALAESLQATDLEIKPLNSKVDDLAKKLTELEGGGVSEEAVAKLECIMKLEQQLALCAPANDVDTKVEDLRTRILQVKEVVDKRGAEVAETAAKVAASEGKEEGAGEDKLKELKTELEKDIADKVKKAEININFRIDNLKIDDLRKLYTVHTESINGVDKRSLETDKRSLKTQEELEKLKEIVKIL